MPYPTTKQQLDYSINLLKSHGIEDPRLEAEILLANILRVDRVKLLTLYNKQLGDQEIKKLRNYVERRNKREPLQYITGKAHFMSLEFEVGPEVLIPRPETELLVETVIRLIRKQTAESGQRKAGIKLLDIGTGSGAIAISLAHYLPSVEVLGIDISKEAIKVAKRNAKEHGVQKRCQFVISDFTTYGLQLTAYNLRLTAYDFVVSNPPYIPTVDILKLQPEIQFEPRAALDGGGDGLNFYRQLIPQAKKYLKRGGYLVVEVGINQSEAVVKILKQNKYKRVKILKDLNQIDRVVYADS